MRVRAGLPLLFGVLVTLALATPASGNEVAHLRESHTGAQAIFDTAAFDSEGNLLPGDYVTVLVAASVDLYVADGQTVQGTALSADITSYQIDADGTWIFVSNVVGWTYDGSVSVEPSLTPHRLRERWSCSSAAGATRARTAHRSAVSSSV